MTLAALHDHQQEHNRVALSALRTIAKQWQLPFTAVRGRFIDGDYPITAEFWRLIHARYPAQFLRVNWCHGCRKFGFEVKLAS